MLTLRWLVPTLMATACAAALAIGQERAGDFRASAVKVDITPSSSKWLAGYPARQSTGVHDHIFHRIVALDDGRTQFFLISSDLCLFAPSVYDEMTARLKRETGIEPLQVWWTVTHTHSAPEVGPHGLLKVIMPERYNHEPDQEYTAWVEKVLIDGIKAARANLAPARLAVGTGFSAANINRRARDVDGHISLGLNPDGPTDRQIGLIRLEHLDGTPIALIANYSMHGTALGQENTLISGDAPGTVATYVEEKLGVPMLFINGAAGNMAPIYTVQPSFDSFHITEFNVLLGDRILTANRSIASATSQVHLRPGEKSVDTPRRAGFGWDESLGNYLRAANGEAGTIRLPVRFLIINEDLALWSAPVELFCEISMNVRDRSPYPHTFYFGYSNGWLGYLATRQAFAEGGYETHTCPFTAQVEDDLTNGVTAYLQGHGR
ncbi:MAG: neutral/alkaline non-lysosomal ceramidase N-terminal domain-containing protein [Acidobacteriia bacterium]|nr:neutral/alkaline non-lysosomal ceramidase N-terminal domain-containing protein [Terriglobia bacterium]